MWKVNFFPLPYSSFLPHPAIPFLYRSVHSSFVFLQNYLLFPVSLHFFVKYKRSNDRNSNDGNKNSNNNKNTSSNNNYYWYCFYYYYYFYYHYHYYYHHYHHYYFSKNSTNLYFFFFVYLANIIRFSKRTRFNFFFGSSVIVMLLNVSPKNKIFFAVIIEIANCLWLQNDSCTFTTSIPLR